MLNLAVWFGLHVIFPNGTRVDWFVVVVASLAFLALLRFKSGLIHAIFASAGLGMLRYLVI